MPRDIPTCRHITIGTDAGLKQVHTIHLERYRYYEVFQYDDEAVKTWFASFNNELDNTLLEKPSTFEIHHLEGQGLPNSIEVYTRLLIDNIEGIYKKLSLFTEVPSITIAIVSSNCVNKISMVRG